jgi:hypothetical protein
MGELDFNPNLLGGSGGFVNAARQLGGIDGVDVAEQLCGLAGFVRLQMANEVKIGSWEVLHQGKLGLEFLHVIFAKIAKAQGMRLEDDVVWEHLGDCEQKYVFPPSTRLLAGTEQSLFHFSQSIFQHSFEFGMQTAIWKGMVPERIAATIENFVATCQAPALLEKGEKPLVLAPDRFKVDITPRGAWLEAWDESRVWSRRILRVGEPSRKKLELEAFRFGKSTASISLVDVADSRTGPAIEKTKRSAFTEQFRYFLNRHFGSWRWESFRSEAKLENSLSPIFPTALLTRGQQAVAAVAAPDRDTSFHALTFALIWLDWVRRNHGDIAASRLLLYLPESHARSVVLLARQLDSKKVQVDIWLYAEGGGEYLLDPADTGNLDSTLAPRYSRLAGPEWWVDFVFQQAAVDQIEEADGSMSYRVRGLEFARLRAAQGNERPRLEYGIRRKRAITVEELPEVRKLVDEILEHRRSQSSQRTHPLFLAEPERWLEAQVRREIQEVEAAVAPDCLYGQALGSLHGERSALDLLGIDRTGRLHIFELKASEDIHLPLQAFDYWLRVRHHLAAGDFEGSGYFPGRVLSKVSPKVFLVSPSLHFHPMTEAVLNYLPPACEMVRIGLNGDWRERIDVVLRM